MASKRYDLFSKISLGITAFYFIVSSFILIMWGPRFDGFPFSIFNFFSDIIIVTWMGYVPFAVISWFVKIIVCAKDKLLFGKRQLINHSLHFVFMSVSFFEIYWILIHSF